MKVLLIFGLSALNLLSATMVTSCTTYYSVAGTQSCSVAQFTPPGTLVSVDVATTVGGTKTFVIDNSTGVNQPYSTLSATTFISLFGPAFSASINYGINAPAGIAPPGTSALLVTGDPHELDFVIAPAALSFYIGSGMLSYSQVVNMPVVSPSPIPGVTFADDATFTIRTDVTYRYISSVPEPGTAWLLLSGLLGSGLLARTLGTYGQVAGGQNRPCNGDRE